MKKIHLFLLLACMCRLGVIAQVGTLTGTGMSICNLYSFTVCPNQTITPLNYGSQGYACTGAIMPDVSFTTNGPAWRVMKNNWFFSATTSGTLSGYSSSGALQMIPFAATNTITPLSYSGSYIQFAINGVATGTLLNQATFSISLNPVTFGNTSYTYCPTTAANVAISPTVPVTGGPWTYIWQPGSMIGSPVNVSPAANMVYTVTARSTGGCTSAATVSVNVNCNNNPVASFIAPDTVCVNQSFSIVNTSTLASSHYWSFCQGNMNTTPNASNLGNIGFFNGPVFSTIARDASGYYVFVTNNTSSSLTRLFYGSNLLNVPVATNLGNVSGALPNSLEDLHLEYESGNWYGIAVGGVAGTERIVRLNFGNSLSNAPTAVSMGNIGGMSYPQRLKIFKSGGNYYGFTTNRNNNTITRFNFGASVTNTPVGVNLGNIGGLNTPDAIALVNVANTWFGYVINEGNNTITRLDFGGSLLNVPLGTNLGNTGALNGPRGLDMWVECNEVRGLITNRFSDDLLNVSLPAGPTGPFTTTSFGNIAGFSFPHSITRFRSGDTLFAFITNVSNNTISRIYYPGCTNASVPSSTLATPPTVSYNAAGTYYINLIINEGLITQTSYCKAITVIGSPTVAVSGASVCAGSAVTLSASGANTYTWANAATLSGSGGSIVSATPSVTTTYTVTGSNRYCTNSAVATVSAIPLPAVAISGNTLTCAGQATTLTAAGATAYTWSAVGLPAGTTNSVITVAPSQTTLYTLTGFDGACSGSATLSVAVTNNTVNVQDIAICAGNSGQLTASGAASYSWANASTLSSPTGSMVVASPLSTQSYTVTGTTGVCTHSAVATVSVVAITPVVASPVTATICAGTNAILTASGAGSYTWNPTVMLLSPNAGSVSVSPSVSTTFAVTGATGFCTDTAFVSVTVLPLPAVAAQDQTICAGATTILSATGAASYSWQPGSVNSSTIMVSPVTTTNYTLNGTSPAGCTSSMFVTVNVVPPGTLSVTSTTTTLCPGTTATLSASGAVSYSWMPGGSTTSTLIVSPSGTNSYTVNGTNLSGCISTGTINLMSLPALNPIISAGEEICLGQSTKLYASGGNKYQWSPIPGVKDLSEAVISVSPSVNTVYSVTVSSHTSCPATATVEVRVNPLPVISAGNDTIVNMDEVLSLIGRGNVPVGFISGTGAPLNCTFCSSIQVNPQENTCYTLMGENEHHCIAFDEVCVTVSKDWSSYIPNAFTPNDDGVNDTFLVYGYGISSIDMEIFDRWGELIFREKETQTGWDGKKGGMVCEQGVYTYRMSILIMTGQRVEKIGHVTLLPKK